MTKNNIKEKKLILSGNHDDFFREMIEALQGLTVYEIP